MDIVGNTQAVTGHTPRNACLPTLACLNLYLLISNLFFFQQPCWHGEGKLLALNFKGQFSENLATS